MLLLLSRLRSSAVPSLNWCALAGGVLNRGRNRGEKTGGGSRSASPCPECAQQGSQGEGLLLGASSPSCPVLYPKRRVSEQPAPPWQYLGVLEVVKQQCWSQGLIPRCCLFGSCAGSFASCCSHGAAQNRFGRRVVHHRCWGRAPCTPPGPPPVCTNHG